MTNESFAPPGARLTALDVFRGVVVLLLVPDVAGGFSFYAMASRFPEDPLWNLLARGFTHVEWAGAAPWDLVMPGFVFAAGAAMALSVAQRRARGDTAARLLAHVLVRAAMLVTLGMLLTIKPRTHLDEALPYLLLACAVPWERLRRGTAPPAERLWLQLLGAVLAAAWLATHLDQLGNYDFNQILVQIGLASVPAYLLLGRGERAPLLGAAAILVAWTLAFLLHPVPAGAPPQAGPAWFAHWDNGRNLAAAFDHWFLNRLPRAVDYAGNSHGYHTLTFVPLAALMLAGAAAARAAARLGPRAAAPRLARAGAIGGLASIALSLAVAPLVKSLWTVSWTVFSAALCTLAFALLLRLCATAGAQRWAVALAILGGHALLLYVISYAHRWRLVAAWDGLLGPALVAHPWRPVLESLLVLATLWLLAALLERLRLRVRL